MYYMYYFVLLIRHSANWQGQHGVRKLPTVLSYPSFELQNSTLAHGMCVMVHRCCTNPDYGSFIIKRALTAV